MALNSIHFSFNRNQNLVTGCCFHLNILKSYTFCKKNVQNERKVRKNH